MPRAQSAPQIVWSIDPRAADAAHQHFWCNSLEEVQKHPVFNARAVWLAEDTSDRATKRYTTFSTLRSALELLQSTIDLQHPSSYYEIIPSPDCPVYLYFDVDVKLSSSPLHAVLANDLKKGSECVASAFLSALEAFLRDRFSFEVKLRPGVNCQVGTQQ